MKPAPFEYFAPPTLDEALSLMKQHGFDAKVLAGGQSLIPVMNFRLSQPTILIDINHIPDLNGISTTDVNGLSIKAMSRHAHAEKSDLVAQHAPLMFETMPYIAHPQIRNRGTIGGSIAHADPAGELPVICVTLDAKFLLKREGSERWVTANDFFIGLFETALNPEEIICEIEIPPLPPNSGYGFHELARRHGDYAQAGASAFIQLDEAGRCKDAKLVFLNVGERPMVADEGAKLLIGQFLDEAVVGTAVHTAIQNEIDPTSDVHATAKYKRHLAGVLAKRALNQAIKRAQTRSAL
ncbi:MAG: xanthine dehydrogenase family protein subunit M [Chloroflexota bacterium]